MQTPDKPLQDNGTSSDGEPTSQLTGRITPTENYTPQTLRSVAGAAGAVWLVCLVANSLIGRDNLTPNIMRLIAIFTSEFIVISLFFVYTYKKTSDSVFMGLLVTFFNGLLIFISASGINSINNGISFEDKESIKKAKASFISLDNDFNWWPDRKLSKKIDSLSKENNKLITRIKIIRAKIELDSCNNIADKYMKVNSSASKSNKLIVNTIANVSKSRIIDVDNHAIKYPSKKKIISKRTENLVMLPEVSNADEMNKVYESYVVPDNCLVSAESADDGCMYNINLLELKASFIGKKDSLSSSSISFVTKGKSMTCRGRYETVVDGYYSFSLSSVAHSKGGEILVQYKSDSHLYVARAYGRFISDKFNGTLIIERPVRKNQPAFRKILKIQTE